MSNILLEYKRGNRVPEALGTKIYEGFEDQNWHIFNFQQQYCMHPTYNEDDNLSSLFGYALE